MMRLPARRSFQMKAFKRTRPKAGSTLILYISVIGEFSIAPVIFCILIGNMVDFLIDLPFNSEVSIRGKVVLTLMATLYYYYKRICSMKEQSDRRAGSRLRRQSCEQKSGMGSGQA